MLKKAEEFMPFGRPARFKAWPSAQRRIWQLAAEQVRLGQLAPFVGEEQHRLGEVQRCKRRIDGGRNDDVGDGDIGILQAGALLAEQNAATPARLPALVHGSRGAMR